ncbi:hypothetical protein [Variovorax sp. Sphag1AA]|uniref:hypothetical protein n=1 Tax=Variovorax sp. Sphag1AA TaxID=2587027 RepID=UPI00162124D2|nr:hypothetical protein [Variovorax sp. Sphag1AA]MBB3178496.1 hypothetical protein [Variovorax sp. Sphag1AA]
MRNAQRCLQCITDLLHDAQTVPSDQRRFDSADVSALISLVVAEFQRHSKGAWGHAMTLMPHWLAHA